MSNEFFMTQMGRKFYESDVPRIAKALESIAVSLKKGQQPFKPPQPPLATATTPNPIDLLRMVNRRIHDEELAGHFPYSLISNISDVLEGRRKVDIFDGRDQPKLEDILGEHYRGIPGIAFPIHHGGECDSVDGKVFISRDDMAGMFRDDVQAANFVACLIGKPWKKFFDQPGKDYFHPYFEVTLDEVERIHATYGSIPVQKEVI